ncbi:hypothetical protein PSHT_06460 [Puccinia striiformis]|uniref:Uncharacterized protein n=1 Tax=Puccinia striiformis TaxID=27350 RepID=A0A2S4W5S5_9BASI|nr:hypothetical protein PSHT_06460 [Puccinia striiformis]
MQENQHATRHSPPANSDISADVDTSTFTLKPAPWSVHCESWWLILSILGSTRKLLDRAKFQPQSRKRSTRSGSGANSDSLGLLSTEESDPAQGFRGGIGFVQIVRYPLSPVGAYDELLLVPGSFKPPEECLDGSPKFRITQIYVSSLESVLNGRRNWNIPKKLARFEFIQMEGSANKTNVKIYGLKSFSFTPSNSSTGWFFEPVFHPTPFFDVIIHRHLPRLNIPVNVGQLPMLDLTILQPPLPVNEPLDPDILGIDSGTAGTSDWKQTELGIKGPCGVCTFKGNLAGRNGQIADGELFPDFKPYRLGIHFPRMYLEIQASTSMTVDPIRSRKNSKNHYEKKMIYSQHNHLLH